ncbi:hypothetical protein [Cyclobacterium qasimii]|uniref:Thioredoxin domain-containing protein n=2 Tax=Cyclobacterium qasimii TaxID=1350429 RepID=A0A512CFD1_9BACT|nr:hypothetical protein [Cyclobacterium qasimii]GEO22932.1 hypothetical protein CQA01_34660 [Cyclobacterium qasimii]
MKNKVTLPLVFFLLILSSSLSFGQIDVDITHIKSGETISFSDIYDTYDLDKELPTMIITWSGEWCYPCISLINRYTDCDLSMMNLITINVDNEENREDVLDEGHHLDWDKALNFHANINEDGKGFDNVFNVTSAPLVLYLVDGMISDAVVSYSLYPYRLIQTERINDINFVWNSSRDLNSLAWSHYKNEDDENELAEAIEWVTRSIDLDQTYSNTDTYAALLFKTGEYTKSLKVAKEAIEIAKENDDDYSTTTDLINSVIEKL